MTPQKKKDWNPEPFPKPRTFPEGWVGDALDAKEQLDEAAPKDDWKPEPFPEPRMFPWDSGR